MCVCLELQEFRIFEANPSSRISQLVELTVAAQDAPAAPRHMRDVYGEVGNPVLLGDRLHRRLVLYKGLGFLGI